MPSSSPKQRNYFMERFCECLPNCGRAIELAERGCQRELSPVESLSLKYNSRLCPFCACATGRFQSVMLSMKQAQEQRRKEALPT